MILKRISLGMGAIIWVCSLASPCVAEDAPMIEKHIFSPDQQVEEPRKPGESPKTERLEREISFTGVIISPKGRLAMIKERRSFRTKDKGSNRSGLYKEGDEIDGMTLKEIGPNYIVLLREGKEVRIKLYKEGKKRPSPPAQPRLGKTHQEMRRIPKRVTPPSSAKKRHVSRPILRKRPTQSPAFPKGK